ncbi:MAG: hypothetical protein R2724_25215 [Bryobacterales bacterium]
MRPAAKRLVRISAAAAGLGFISAWIAGWVSETASWPVVAVLVLSRTLAAALFRLDRLHWRALALRDSATAALACAGGSAIAAAASAGLPQGWPARILAADCALYACLLGTAALLAAAPRLRTPARSRHAVRTLIWGAGVEGRTLLERVRRHNPGIEVFGWLDDDPALAELDCDGLPVLGPLESLPLLVEPTACGPSWPPSRPWPTTGAPRPKIWRGGQAPSWFSAKDPHGVLKRSLRSHPMQAIRCPAPGLAINPLGNSRRLGSAPAV